jgi:GNAT superfamily N-acetyltransferase
VSAPRIVATDFETVGQIWREKLWPGRRSEILPTSAIRFGGGYDLELLERTAVFFKLVIYAAQAGHPAQGEEILGVISGFSTHDGYFRSRGLYVSSAFRGRGYSQLLLAAVADHAKAVGCSFVWSLPRRASWEAYRRFGFELASEWTEEGMEFGPNAFAVLRL